jgi:transposase
MRITKVDLFENIRKDYQLHGKSIHQIARDYNIHRRTVRQALYSAIPPFRRGTQRSPSVMTPLVIHLINQWLESDLKAPRKQCHTGTRIYQRLVEEMGFKGAAVTVRLYVKKQKMLLGRTQTVYVPQTYLPGEEAEVDWYEAQVIINGLQQKLYFFEMRACYSGREFHMASYTLSQHAFLEAHIQAFTYFGGVFKTIRYDNLTVNA